MNSINTKNLLELRPIQVNADYEIIDGQHRLMAAKNLGLEIYYEVKKDLDSFDIIRLNANNKNWAMKDYFNYFLKNEYCEYIKLDEFMKKNNLPLHISVNIVMGKSNKKIQEYKSGNLIFPESHLDSDLYLCHNTIDLIKSVNNYSVYTKSSRFWRALISLINYPDFDSKKWMANLEKMACKCGPRVSYKDYLSMLLDIYNWRNPKKIDIGIDYKNGMD